MNREEFKQIMMEKLLEKYVDSGLTEEELDLEKSIEIEIERMKQYTTHPDKALIRKQQEKLLLPILDEIQRDKQRADELASRNNLYEILSYTLEKSIENDIGVDFSVENIYTHPEKYPCPVGIQSIDDFHYIGICAGGDWEYPLYFILFLNAKGEMEGYVPREGNVFNRDEDAAFGNHETDDEYAKQHFGVTVDDLETDHFDWALILQDIKKKCI